MVPSPARASDILNGLRVSLQVFGDHGGGSEASYQRTLQQAAGGYPQPENENEHDDMGDLEGDIYDEEDADSNEQERPASMMSPANRTVSNRLSA